MSALDVSTIEEVLAVVAEALCETFPNDFNRRCAFSAFGARALLREAGTDAVLVGGQFSALVITPDRSRLGIQGFSSGNEHAHPHFWVEAEGRLIDLSPHFLPFGSEYPIVPMPALAWDLWTPLPAAFRYRAEQRYPADNPMSSDPSLCAQADAFVALCRARHRSLAQRPALPTWLATGYATLIAAIERQDPWACGAKRLEQMLPFVSEQSDVRRSSP